MSFPNRLICLVFLLMLQISSFAGDGVGKDVFDAQKELLQQKIDNGRELTQKDVEKLQVRMDAFDKRIDDQNNRVSDVGQSIDRFSVILSVAGIVVTLLLAGIGLFGYISVTRKTAEEAKQASQKWFDDNQVALVRRVRDLESAAEAAHQKIDSSVINMEDHVRQAIGRVQENISTHINQAELIGSVDAEALKQVAEKIRRKPEVSYSFDDWNTRAFNSYQNGQMEEAALFWHNASIAPDVLDLDSAQARFNRANLLSSLGRSHEALDEYKYIMENYLPGDSIVIKEIVSKSMLNRGVEFNKLGEFENSIASYNDLISYCFSDGRDFFKELLAKAMFNKGVDLLSLHRLSEAVTIFNEIIAIFSGSTDISLRRQVVKAMASLVGAYGDMEKFDKSLEVYEAVIGNYISDADPGIRECVVVSIMNMGVSYTRMDRDNDALPIFERVISYCSTETTPLIQECIASAYNWRGYWGILEAKKVWGEGAALTFLKGALADLDAGLKYNKGFDLLIGNLSYVYWLLGNELEAEDRFRSAIVMAGDNGENLYQVTLEDITKHPTPKDDGFRAMVERLWHEHQNKSSKAG